MYLTGAEINAIDPGNPALSFIRGEQLNLFFTLPLLSRQPGILKS